MPWLIAYFASALNYYGFCSCTLEWIALSALEEETIRAVLLLPTTPIMYSRFLKEFLNYVHVGASLVKGSDDNCEIGLVW